MTEDHYTSEVAAVKLWVGALAHDMCVGGVKQMPSEAPGEVGEARERIGADWTWLSQSGLAITLAVSLKASPV